MTHPIAGADPLPDRPPGVDPLLSQLTAEQRTAVTHGSGPLLLLAGPGAGKTKTLTTASHICCPRAVRGRGRSSR